MFQNSRLMTYSLHFVSLFASFAAFLLHALRTGLNSCRTSKREHQRTLQCWLGRELLGWCSIWRAFDRRVDSYPSDPNTVRSIQGMSNRLFDQKALDRGWERITKSSSRSILGSRFCLGCWRTDSWPTNFQSFQTPRNNWWLTTRWRKRKSRKRSLWCRLPESIYPMALSRHLQTAFAFHARSRHQSSNHLWSLWHHRHIHIHPFLLHKRRKLNRLQPSLSALQSPRLLTTTGAISILPKLSFEVFGSSSSM